MTTTSEEQLKIEPRRIRNYPMTGELFTRLFVHGFSLHITDGIPEGAKFVGMSHDFRTNSMCIYVEHESFDQVLEGNEIPVKLIIGTREDNKPETAK